MSACKQSRLNRLIEKSLGPVTAIVIFGLIGGFLFTGYQAWKDDQSGCYQDGPDAYFCDNAR